MCLCVSRCARCACVHAYPSVPPPLPATAYLSLAVSLAVSYSLHSRLSIYTSILYSLKGVKKGTSTERVTSIENGARGERQRGGGMHTYTTNTMMHIDAQGNTLPLE